MAPHNGRHKSALDLAPLERDCMSALWPLGEGTVREIREALIPVCPRAYTTIMTIMDRLAHKGVVSRRKVGKAYLYRPNFTAEEARARAVGRLVENYFGGSTEALVTHLTSGPAPAMSPPVFRATMNVAPVVATADESAGRETPIDETLL